MTPPKKTHKQNFGIYPVPGQSRKFVYVYVFLLSLRNSQKVTKYPRFPVLLFLGVFVSLLYFFLGISLVFLSVFCLFYMVLEGLQREKNPW